MVEVSPPETALSTQETMGDPSWAPEVMPFLEDAVPNRGGYFRYFKSDGSELVGNYYDRMGSAQGGRRVTAEAISGRPQYLEGKRDERVVQELRIPYYPDRATTIIRTDYFYDNQGRLVCARQVEEQHEGPLVTAKPDDLIVIGTKFENSNKFTEKLLKFMLYRYSDDGMIFQVSDWITKGDSAHFSMERDYDPKTAFPSLYLPKQASK